MKKLINLVTVAGLALVAAASAHAQVPSVLGTGDIKLGIFNPSGSNGKTYMGSTVFSAGLDYTPPGIPGVQRPTIYGDYEGGTKNGGHVDTIGLGVATKWSPPVVGQLTKITPYAGIGVGGYWLNITNGATSQSGKSITVGGKVFAGLNFDKYLIEANYQLLPSEHGVNPSGFGVQVGMQF